MHEHVHLNIRINKLIISLQLNSSPIMHISETCSIH